MLFKSVNLLAIMCFFYLFLHDDVCANVCYFYEPIVPEIKTIIFYSILMKEFPLLSLLQTIAW